MEARIVYDPDGNGARAIGGHWPYRIDIDSEPARNNSGHIRRFGSKRAAEKAVARMGMSLSTTLPGPR